MSKAAEIIESLREAVAGNFSSVYIEGQHWVRSDWQPIETAPRDGTRIVGFSSEAKEQFCIVRWDNGWRCWFSTPGKYQVHPTHWMPLPHPPVQER